MTTETNKPVYKAKAGKFEASEWDNEGIPSITLRKAWLKKDGDSKNQEDWSEVKMTIFPREISDAILVLKELERHTRLKP